MKKFTRRTEDFLCRNCGTKNIGNGYTNHCRKCLWSMHVDIYPGDRLSTCHGMMCPHESMLWHGSWRVKHVCIECGFERWASILKSDDFSTLIEII